MQEKKFVNELGNEIIVRVTDKETCGLPGVLLFIAGPKSDIENHITLMEAEVICEQLSLVIEQIKKSLSKRNF